MTPAAALRALRAVGGDVVLTDGRPAIKAARGLVPLDLEKQLRAHRDAIREIILGEQRDRRLREVTRAFGGLNDRLAALGPWSAAQLEPHHDLAEVVDREAKAYVDGEAMNDYRFRAALDSWEAALRVGRGLPNSGQAEASRIAPVPEVSP